MGIRDFVDGITDLIRVVQLRNYFSNIDTKDTINTNKNIKLKKSIINNKLHIYKDFESEDYLVDGQDILKVKKELKEIGAVWNENKKSVVLSKDLLMNNVDKATLEKIKNDIKIEESKNINGICEKIINKDLELISENDKYKVIGYTKEIQKVLLNIGFNKIDNNYYIDKLKFKDIFPLDIQKVVDIKNNEYVEKVDNQKEKIVIKANIVDRNNSKNKKIIQFPITLLEFSRLKEELGANNLKISKINSNDNDINMIFQGKSNVADINTIHKFNVLSRCINEFNKEDLQDYKKILKIEGLKNINDYVECANRFKEEILER